jgi:SlyX protein
VSSDTWVRKLTAVVAAGKGTTMAAEQRLIEIETKLAHQERLLSELDSALTSQQAQMTRLEQLCQSMIARLRTMADAAPAESNADERPPHY